MVQVLLNLLRLMRQNAAAYYKPNHQILDFLPDRSVVHQCRHMMSDCWQAGAPRPPCFSIARLGEEFHNLCNKGELDKALNVLLLMDQHGSPPLPDMYSVFLKACARDRALRQVKRVHALIAKQGPKHITSLGENVVSTLVKCGGLHDALHLFHTLPHRTAFSWTALICGYSARGESKEALRMYHRMQQEGVEPNKYTFIGLLRACGQLPDLEEGKRVHAQILRFRCETDVFVGTCLVDMYGKCGSVTNAHKVFDALSHPNVASWTALLTCCAQQGQPRKALLLYERMREQSVSPDVRTYASVLQACATLAETDEHVIVNGQIVKLKSLVQGKLIHSDVWRKDHHTDVFVGSALVTMYGKCGSSADAHNVFQSLPHPNGVSWTAMLAAHAQAGQPHKALHLYDQMQQQGVSTDVWTFVTVLQACGMLAEKAVPAGTAPNMKLKLLKTGKVIHAHTWAKGMSSSVFLSSTLVTMYAKCGSIEDAQCVFHGDRQLNVVSWTAMVAAYVEQDEPGRACQLYENMWEQGVSPNDRTFVAVLQACSMLAEGEQDEVLLDGVATKAKSLGHGKALHAEICRKGYGQDVFVCSTLISLYGKCGSIAHAQNVFHGLSQRNVVVWNAMLASYSQHGQADKALQLYGQMQDDEGVSPNDRTFVSALKACSMLAGKEEHTAERVDLKAKYLEVGKAIHAAACRKGYSSDVFICNTLISMYGKCGSSMHAQKVFDGLSQRNVVSWNTLLSAYAEQGQAEEVFEKYGQMQGEGMSADAWTFVTVLQACIMLAAREGAGDKSMTLKSVLVKGKSVHSDASRKGYDVNLFVGSTLISMYGKCGSMADARIVLEGLAGQDVVPWNAMLAAYVEQEQHENVVQLYERMQVEKVAPNEATYLLLLQSCSRTGRLDMCRQIHNHLATEEGDLSLLLATTLIHAYGRCGSMVDARTVFAALAQPDVVAWNAMIAGYFRQGDSGATLQCYEQMQVAGVKPNEVTFLSVLASCSHAGLVDVGMHHFESMTSQFCLTPEVDHYVCMVDLLGRAGHFTMVEHMLSTLPIQPNLSMWLCLLGACRKHGKVLLGKQAFDSVVKVHPRHGAAYVLMSNIYADAGLWDCSKDVNELEQQAGTWKKPCGQSWIENKQQVQTFIVDDPWHLDQDQQLYDFLTEVKCKLALLITCAHTSSLPLTGVMRCPVSPCTYAKRTSPHAPTKISTFEI